MIEREILKRIGKINTLFISNLLGEYFISDINNKVESLVLLTEAGEFSLEQLISNRRKKSLPPYKAEGALTILAEINKAMEVLQKNLIYHSNIRDRCIDFCPKRKGFLLTDFSMSTVLKLGDKNKSNLEVKMIDIIYGMDEPNMSPEKKLYFQSKTKNKPLFNPFKCDMWSLGTCLEKMICIDLENPKIDNLNIENIRNLMKNSDWNHRLDAFELKTHLAKCDLNIREKLIESLENENLEELREERRKTFPEVYSLINSERLGEAVLNIAKNEYNEFIEIYGELPEKIYWKEYDSRTSHLGILVEI